MMGLIMIHRDIPRSLGAASAQTFRPRRTRDTNRMSSHHVERLGCHSSTNQCHTPPHPHRHTPPALAQGVSQLGRARPVPATVPNRARRVTPPGSPRPAGRQLQGPAKKRAGPSQRWRSAMPAPDADERGGEERPRGAEGEPLDAPEPGRGRGRGRGRAGTVVGHGAADLRGRGTGRGPPRLRPMVGQALVCIVCVPVCVWCPSEAGRRRWFVISRSER
jgi:hypothetical protein